MKTIFRCQFGSVIYGTNLPTSDKDYKSIYVPEAQDIILQRVQNNITKNTKSDQTTRNTSEDIDDETFSYQEFLKLLLQGQTPMLDCLFCPEEFVEVSSPEWELIKENKQHFLHKGVSQFVGYTKAQAAKYGLKGSRVDAARKTVEFLKSLDPQTTLHQNLEALEKFVEDNKETKMDENLPLIGWDYAFPKNKKDDDPKLYRHFSCVNRKTPLTSKVKYALDNYQKVLDTYGERAKMAERNEGIDWKALYHSVRVGRQAEELLLTGHITLPRPEKELLLQIRKGELPYQQVAELIEEGLTKMNEAVAKSTLPEKPNFELADELTCLVYKLQLFDDFVGVLGQGFQREYDDLVKNANKQTFRF